MSEIRYDAIVLGAGAAGLMCAIEAGKRGKRVLLLDHAESIGKKILISGGGRCNFTNIHCKPENFLSANPHFAKSALARYTPQDILALRQPRVASRLRSRLTSSNIFPYTSEVFQPPARIRRRVPTVSNSR